MNSRFISEQIIGWRAQFVHSAGSSCRKFDNSHLAEADLNLEPRFASVRYTISIRPGSDPTSKVIGCRFPDLNS